MTGVVPGLVPEEQDTMARPARGPSGPIPSIPEISRDPYSDLPRPNLPNEGDEEATDETSRSYASTDVVFEYTRPEGLEGVTLIPKGDDTDAIAGDANSGGAISNGDETDATVGDTGSGDGTISNGDSSSDDESGTSYFESGIEFEDKRPDVPRVDTGDDEIPQEIGIPFPEIPRDPLDHSDLPTPNLPNEGDEGGISFFESNIEFEDKRPDLPRLDSGDDEPDFDPGGDDSALEDLGVERRSRER